MSLRVKDFILVNSKISFAFKPLEININILQTNSLSYYTLGLFVLGIKNIIFLEFLNKSNIKAIKETRPLLLLKKVFKVNKKGNKI